MKKNEAKDAWRNKQMQTSTYKMEITTIVGGTPTAECLEKIISNATGDYVSVIREE